VDCIFVTLSLALRTNEGRYHTCSLSVIHFLIRKLRAPDFLLLSFQTLKWNQDLWSSMISQSQGQFGNETATLPHLTVFDSQSSMLSIESVTYATGQVVDGSSSASPLVSSFFVDPVAIPSLLATVKATLSSRAGVPAVPARFQSQSVYSYAIPSIVMRILNFVTGASQHCALLPLLDDDAETCKLGLSLIVDDRSSGAWHPVFHQLSATAVQHASAALGALLAVSAVFPAQWNDLFWDAWIAMYWTTLHLHQSRIVTVQPAFWPVSVFAVEKLLHPTSVSAVMLGCSPYYTSGRAASGIAFHSLADAPAAIKGMKKYGFDCEGDHPVSLVQELGVGLFNLVRLSVDESQLSLKVLQAAWLPYSLRVVDYLRTQWKLSVDNVALSAELPVSLFWQETSDVNVILAHLLRPEISNSLDMINLCAIPPPNEFYVQAQLLATAPKANKSSTSSRSVSPVKVLSPSADALGFKRSLSDKPTSSTPTKGLVAPKAITKSASGRSPQKPSTPKASRTPTAERSNNADKPHPVVFLRDMLAHIKALNQISSHVALTQGP
jgi:hypothetical protein